MKLLLPLVFLTSLAAAFPTALAPRDWSCAECHARLDNCKRMDAAPGIIGCAKVCLKVACNSNGACKACGGEFDRCEWANTPGVN